MRSNVPADDRRLAERLYKQTIAPNINRMYGMAWEHLGPKARQDIQLGQALILVTQQDDSVHDTTIRNMVVALWDYITDLNGELY